MCRIFLRMLGQCQMVVAAAFGCALLLQGCGPTQHDPKPIDCGLSSVVPPCMPHVGAGLALKFQKRSTTVKTAVSRFAALGIRTVRLWDYDRATLQALLDNGIKDVSITVPNNELSQLADSKSTLSKKIAALVQSFDKQGMTFVISVGNEPTAPWEKGSVDKYLAPGLENMYNALSEKGLDQKVQLTVVFDMSIMATSYPPQIGKFGGGALVQDVIKKIKNFGGVFSVNIYPFFTASKTPAIPLNLALGLEDSFVDGRTYNSLLHQQIASVRAALIDLGSAYAELPLIISETGWPSQGTVFDRYATVGNACTYMHSLLKSADGMDPNLRAIYYFEGFDELRKASFGQGEGGELENHFGFIYESGNDKFQALSFACETTPGVADVISSMSNNATTRRSSAFV